MTITTSQQHKDTAIFMMVVPTIPITLTTHVTVPPYLTIQIIQILIGINI